MFSQTKLLVASNTISQIAGRIITSSASLVISLIIANKYGPGGYGDFIKITTFLAVFYLLADFGMNAVFLRDQQESWPILVTTRFIVSLFLMFAASGLLIFLPTGSTNGYTPYVKLGIFIFIPSIFLQAMVTTQNAVFQKHLKYHLATIASSIGTIIPLLFIWAGTNIFLPGSAIIFCIVCLMTGMLVTVLTGLTLTKSFVPLRLQWDRLKMKSLFLASIPLGLTLVCNVIYFRADSFILTITRSTTEVGIYGLAYKFFEFPLALPTFFMNAMYPLILANIGEIRGLLKKSFWFLLAASVIISILVWFGSPYLSFIKNDFTNSIYPLRILSLGYPFFFLSSLFMWCFVALKKQGILILIYGISMLANILANTIYIPVYGYMAAGWITVISELFICAVSGGVLFRILKKETV